MNHQAKGFLASFFLHILFILGIVHLCKFFPPEKNIALDFDFVKQGATSLPKKEKGGGLSPLTPRKEKPKETPKALSPLPEKKEEPLPTENPLLPVNNTQESIAVEGYNVGSSNLVSGEANGEGGRGMGGGEEGRGEGGGMGGSVFESTSLDSPLKIISFIPPKYPEIAKENGISGIVKIRLLINPEGMVDNAEIIKEDPKGFDFAKEALKVVKDYRFSQPKVLKKPVFAYYILPFRFQLEE